MSRFRTYFSKNNSIIKNNRTNISQNPVTEISYGTEDKNVSRFIFEPDLTNLNNRIYDGQIKQNNIVNHVLHLINTVSYAPQYRGGKSYTDDIDRATGFEIEIFNLKQDWDEGNGYDFYYNDSNLLVHQESNWYSAQTGTLWTEGGAYISGTSEIIGYQYLENGSENISIDVTDYINQRLLGSGNTYTGTSYGLGLKMTDFYEDIETLNRQAVAFHVKDTNTYYEPYIETIIDDTITDDRNYFYLDKDNQLYLFVTIGNNSTGATINSVSIYDHEDVLYVRLSGSSITETKKGMYKIPLNISSTSYPDGIMFRDVWNITLNGRTFDVEDDFFLISSDVYYRINSDYSPSLDNYHFYYWGIGDGEEITGNNLRRIRLSIKELYSDQNDRIPLNIEYRIFTKIAEGYENEIVPYTKVDRTKNGYQFDLDPIWLIPQVYYLQTRLVDGNYYQEKEPIEFVINDRFILVDNDD